MPYAFEAMSSSAVTPSSVVDLLARRATDDPASLAFDVKGARLTWDGLYAACRRAAATLARAGAAPGVPCAMVLNTSPEFLAAFFGAQLLGAIPVAMSPRLTTTQVQRRATQFGCSAVVAAGPLAASLPADGPHVVAAERLLEPQPWRSSDLDRLADGISHLQVTSGTTGEPRAVTIRHANVMAGVRSAEDAIDPSPRDVLVGWLPLHHDLGLVRFVLESIYFGTPSYLLEPAMSALPTWLETITRVGGTITAAPDFAYRIVGRLLDPRRIDLRTLRAATNGGEVVRRTSIRVFEEVFKAPGVVQPGYGLAEATLGVSLVRPGEPIRADESGTVSCGRALASVSIRIADDAGHSVRAGTPGRILVHGPTVAEGYWQDPLSTAAVLTNGWLDTGDLGSLDAGGELYVLGRTRAMIKRAGATIAPREIEEVVDELPGARRSAAVGLRTDDDSMTEDVHLVVEIERSVRREARAALADTIARQMREALGFAPRAVRLVSPGTIPRTATGKTQYGELRRQLERGLLD
jgi:acyl-CoA synthetase (AMP-forming)/AMP-acid ligase II